MIKPLKTLFSVIAAIGIVILWMGIVLPCFPLHVWRWIKIKKKYTLLLTELFKDLPVESFEVRLLYYGGVELRSLNGESIVFNGRREPVTRVSNPIVIAATEEQKIMLVSMNLKEEELKTIKERVVELTKNFRAFTTEDVVMVFENGKLKVNASFLTFWRVSPHIIFTHYFDN